MLAAAELMYLVVPVFNRTGHILNPSYFNRIRKVFQLAKVSKFI